MNAAIIPTLVKGGADLKIRDVRGRTVYDLLRLAIAENWGSKKDCEQVLNVLGAKLNCCGCSVRAIRKNI